MSVTGWDVLVLASVVRSPTQPSGRKAPSLSEPPFTHLRVEMANASQGYTQWLKGCVRNPEGQLRPLPRGLASRSRGGSLQRLRPRVTLEVTTTHLAMYRASVSILLTCLATQLQSLCDPQGLGPRNCGPGPSLQALLPCLWAVGLVRQWPGCAMPRAGRVRAELSYPPRGSVPNRALPYISVSSPYPTLLTLVCWRAKETQKGARHRCGAEGLGEGRGSWFSNTSGKERIVTLSLGYG